MRAVEWEAAAFVRLGVVRRGTERLLSVAVGAAASRPGSAGLREPAAVRITVALLTLQFIQSKLNTGVAEHFFGGQRCEVVARDAVACRTLQAGMFAVER